MPSGAKLTFWYFFGTIHKTSIGRSLNHRGRADVQSLDLGKSLIHRPGSVLLMAPTLAGASYESVPTRFGRCAQVSASRVRSDKEYLGGIGCWRAMASHNLVSSVVTQHLDDCDANVTAASPCPDSDVSILTLLRCFRTCLRRPFATAPRCCTVETGRENGREHVLQPVPMTQNCDWNTS